MRLLPTARSQTATALMQSTGDTPQSDCTSRSFSQRVRCTQVRFLLHRVASPDVLKLLCERRALSVLRMETPLAEAGDPHAIRVLGFVGNDGRCDLLAASRPAAARRSKALAIAEQNGATPQTLRRLDALLTEEEPGPSGEELEACRQAAAREVSVEGFPTPRAHPRGGPPAAHRCCAGRGSAGAHDTRRSGARRGPRPESAGTGALCME